MPNTMIPKELLNQISVGDGRELSRCIPNGSIDLIFTDPPWSRDDLHLFEWLGREAARVLAPDGMLLTFCGKAQLPVVMQYLSAGGLHYHWLIVGYQPDSNMVFNPRRMMEKYRPALLYTKQREPVLPHFVPDLRPTKKDKRYHEWGQGEEFWRFYLDNLADERGVVLDPFCGGGTIPAVCKQLGHDYVAFEVEPDTAAAARGRVQFTQPPLFVQGPEQIGMTI